MPTSGEFTLYQIEDIFVVRGARQRTELKNIEELADSIARVGLLNPPVITRNGDLVAGERRLTAVKLLVEQGRWSSTTIPVHFVDEVDKHELHAIELEENIKRLDLPWKDMAIAVAEYHQIRAMSDEAWNMEKSGNELGLTPGWISRCVQVAGELLKNNSRIHAATGVDSAYNIMSRQRERNIADELSDIDNLIHEDDKPAVVQIVTEQGKTIEVPAEEAPAKPQQTIFNANFLEWAARYDGPKFNFLHCDFPYGVGHHNTDQGGSARWGSYEDSEETYWELCRGLATHLDNILKPSAHIMFWFSMDYYCRTLQFFHQETDFNVQPFPLYWMKTDNKGLLPDPARGPRRIVETALFMSRGDRKIIQAVSNGYGAPSSKEIHISEKPIPVLNHFFRMVVDQNTEMLDPTCGSGTSVRAAYKLGAKRVLGLELNPEYAEAAQTAFTIQLNKEALANAQS